MKIFPMNFDHTLKHEYCSLFAPLLTLSFSSEISIMILVYPQRVMLQLKNAMIYSQRATLLIQLGTTVIWALAHLKKNLNLLGQMWQSLQTILAVWRASNNKKSAPNGHYNPQQAATPDQITQQDSLQKTRGP
jgi:hypothetical protein